LKAQEVAAEIIPEGTPLYAYQARHVLGITAETLREWTALDLVPHDHIGKVKVKYPCAQDLRDWHRDRMFSNVRPSA